jgi:hypothetical protein
MGRVDKTLSARIIDDVPDRHCNRLLIERTPSGYHLHLRGLKIELNEAEMREWKIAFSKAREEVLKNDYLHGDIL